jgi:cytoskeletal protein CcmA (bactofilin family)
MWNRESSNKDEAQRPAPPVLITPAIAPTPTTTRPVEEERRLVAWVGKSVLFRGDLISLEDMTIDGRVEGTIELRDHALTIGPDGTIQADITAKAVSILGKVTGSINASEMVYIAETGSVEGNITARRVSMADGAVVRGRVETSARAADSQARPSQTIAAV